MMLYQPTSVIVLLVRPSFGSAFTADSCRIHNIKRNVLRFFSANNQIQCRTSDKRISSDRTAISTAAITNRSQGPTALDPIEDTVNMCLTHYRQSAIASTLVPLNAHINITQYPQKHRESIAVSIRYFSTFKFILCVLNFYMLEQNVGFCSPHRWQVTWNKLFSLLQEAVSIVEDAGCKGNIVFARHAWRLRRVFLVLIGYFFW